MGATQTIFKPGDLVQFDRDSDEGQFLFGKYGGGTFTVVRVESVPANCCACGALGRPGDGHYCRHNETLTMWEAIGHPQWVVLTTLGEDEPVGGGSLIMANAWGRRMDYCAYRDQRLAEDLRLREAYQKESRRIARRLSRFYLRIKKWFYTRNKR